MKHIVKYTESERGWGGEIWYRGFDSEEEARAEVHDTNKNLPKDHVPDYYIQAKYDGVKDKVPEGYKF
ncbi:hypothetical protein [Salmonella phage vB_SalS_ABTNLsp9]|uniref:Uncharacterized protein n=7 Tax=Markadamsvirinae TaxID=2732013 RepID=A0A6G6XR33_9CAUD|nr:hypothetical protein BN79_059 [Yersinia phage phiR2-01]YP_009785195.1 hypothetical protein HOR05_gp149 [Escherichia phage phiAPCEc03]YP_009856462.1 hypothetical protein HWD08_gp066 [Salmonella phage L6jm]YP_009856879.1 hypothetical protein HWD11_gp167 [Phage NBEco002]QPI13553.1 hypothetical protein [Salmonella phage vB_SalS_ABTNLsp9]UGO56067.1 hypothetical protein JLBYU40_78 [Escherichia phage JLBYU40]UUT40795.1 hypothetical protein [Salmonella phage GSP001]AKO61405.1 hypothetical protein